MLGKLTVLIAVGLLSSAAFATSLVTPGIRGSDHDFARFLFMKTTTTVGPVDPTTGLPTTISTPGGYGGTTVTGTAGADEICIFCHAPHTNGRITMPTDGSVVQADAPLWNHTITSQTFTPYTSGTLNSVPGQPNGTSKLCLSCHDGSIALEAYGKATTGTHFIYDSKFGGTGSTTGAAGATSSTKLIGTDLTNDHPISFVYDAALVAADKELNDPVTATILPGLNSVTGTIKEKLLDRTGQVQCTSCHDVHNTAGINKLLKVNNTGSALCLTCHNK
jgi:predicted CXXCH cytochrome family protein